MLPLLCGAAAVPLERAKGLADQHEDPQTLVTGPHGWTLNALMDGDQSLSRSQETSLLDILQERHFSNVHDRATEPTDNALDLRWDESALAPFVDDHSWTDVERWATNVCAARTCTPRDKMDGPRDLENCLGEQRISQGFSEGLGGGLPFDCGKEYLNAGEWEHTQLFDEGAVWFRNGVSDDLVADLNYTRADLAADCNASKVKVNYGCWFTMLGKQGASGASVNVGKSLRFKGRGAAAKLLGLPCSNFPYCDQPHQPMDKLWCHAAQKLGYDSIQIRSAADDQHHTELVICKGCGEAALNGACPPLALKRGSWDSRLGSCECDDSADRLNCGDSTDFKHCQMEMNAWVDRPFKNRWTDLDSVKTLVAGPALREQDPAGHVTLWPGRWISPTTFACVYRGNAIWAAKVGAPWGVFTVGTPLRIEGGEAAVQAAFNDDQFVGAMLTTQLEDFIISPGS
jgi:hypothetical protein